MSYIPLASRLEGLTIDKWKVNKKRIKTTDDHSGVFSSCYEVKNIENGHRSGHGRGVEAGARPFSTTISHEPSSKPFWSSKCKCAPEGTIF